MKKLYDKDTRPGSATCPSCKSDRWQSARTVVLESTPSAQGTFTGTANTAARQSSGVKESLLSDRWFSWNYPIAADSGLNASTGLVQEVKRFMVEYGPAVQMPSPPPEPLPPTSITPISGDVRQNSPVAQAPTESIPAGRVREAVKRKDPKKSTASSMSALILMVIVVLMVGLPIANAYFGIDFLAMLPLFIILAWIMTIATIKAINRRTGRVENEPSLEEKENWLETLEHYAKDRERFQEEAKRFRIRHEESQRKLNEYKRVAEERAIYEQKLSEYEYKKLAVLKTRELLWERTRICMRCGSAYLGPV